MSLITRDIRDRLRSDLTAVGVARRSGDRERCRELLEEAHVLSQPSAVWHVRVHGAMLAAGAGERDGREAWGQLIRLMVAGPGSVTGRHPLGNTGRARVPATQPMPIREDLAEMLRTASR